MSIFLGISGILVPLQLKFNGSFTSMLSRRFLRIKVMQAIYAFQQDGPENINTGEKQLLTSLDKLYELFVYQLSLVLEVCDFARRRIEESKLKFLPTPEELNPNTRFIDNKFLAQLYTNRDLQKKIEASKINWVDEEEMIRKLFNQMREHEDYIAYMAKPIATYQDDKLIVESLFVKLFADSELLRSYYEEKSLYWTDDFDITLMMLVKTIKGYKESYDDFTPLPTLLKDENDPGGSEDLRFVKQLYRKVLMHEDEYNAIIASHADNWELDRIAMMDTILIKMAITEFVEFTSIPVKVTLNEYIELSKSFSTPKSKVFINGVLDKLIVEFRASGKIAKTGRGLLE